jgi:hypothetical protein
MIVNNTSKPTVTRSMGYGNSGTITIPLAIPALVEAPQYIAAAF